ncbi:hypothetical protein ABL78_5655 [Leptomonas seymouri]|uniref:Uncharacterized protein n=1 Tax=Leptomonas seymouri TaxID=5684 RepID=A0A0N1I384_LEPSE|nr:hypothetical protein ABL78_5655 [Leptomonas seymouri]|eukprot:KPI85288.1 hypothetical protein ABL78_5655 [Leptomonas seymouri]
MGCLVCTPSASADTSRNTRPTHTADGDNGLRLPTHTEKCSDSSLPSHLQQQLDGLKVDMDSGSEGPGSMEAQAMQPHHVAVTRRHTRKRVNLMSNNSQRAPSLNANNTNGVGTNNKASYASRQSKLSLHSSPFPKSPTKYEPTLCVGGGAMSVTSSSASAVPVGSSGVDGVRVGTGDIALSTRPQLPQYSQQQQHQLYRHLSSTASTSNQGCAMQESMLSDISESFSSTDGSALDLVSPMHYNGYGGRGSIKAGLFRGGDDLEAQRQLAQPSIEEDLFVYDDIVISKDEARTKHWRLAGRKPTVVLDSASPDMLGRRRSRSNSLKGKQFFTFNDFDICVDEMDCMPATNGAASSIAPLRQNRNVASSHSDLKSMTVTSTVPKVPNTVAHFESEARKMEPKSKRPLRSFQATSALGHATRVKCIALSPSETDFASCSNEDASISLNNLNMGSEVGIFTGHQDTIINATFSPDGKYLATTSKDKTMILWDVVTTKTLLTFTHPKVVICCCFSPDSKYLVSGCQDRICRLWDTKRGKEWLSYTGHEGIIISIAFSPDGNYVCSASADKSLRVWSATTTKTRLHLTGHAGIILSCSYTTDGRHIISNDESLLCVWSAEDGSCKLSLSPAAVAGVTMLSARGPKLGWTLSSAAPGAFTGHMLVACNNRFVYVLDIESGEEVTSVFCKAPVYCLTAGSSEKMACGDSFGNIYILALK